jgi:hypothetical protein
VVTSFKADPGEIVVDLGGLASPRLVRWLCAVLSPKPGWSADGGDFPPWAAFFAGHVCFVVVKTDVSAPLSLKEPPPNSAKASELLIELCSLYGLLD